MFIVLNLYKAKNYKRVPGVYEVPNLALHIVPGAYEIPNLVLLIVLYTDMTIKYTFTGGLHYGNLL